MNSQGQFDESIDRVAVYGFDRFVFKATVLLLVLSCSVTLLPVYIGASANHSSLIYPDAPLGLFLATLVLFSSLLGIPRSGKGTVFWASIPCWLLTVWWAISGLMWAKKIDFFIASWLQYFIGILVFTVTPWIIYRYRLGQFAFRIIQYGAIGVSIGGFIQGVTNPASFFEDITSTLGPNHAQIGIYMMASLAISLFQLTQKRSKISVITASLSFITILISGSRASQMGAIPIVGIFVIQRLSFVNLLKFVVILALVGGVMSYIMKKRESFKNQSTEFVIKKGVTVDKSSGRRLLMWLATWDVIHSSPKRMVMGFGYTNFRWEYGHLIKLPFYTNAAHNAYLHIWGESGVIGLVLYLLSYIGLIGASWHRRKLHSGALLLGGLVLGMMITAMTQESLYTNEAMCNVNVFFMFVCSLLLTASSSPIIASVRHDLK